MQSLLILLLVLGFAEAATRFQSTTVNAQVVLRCKRPWDSRAEVFLMESDFDSNVVDEDDVMDFSRYEFGNVPESRLTLRGEEFEVSGLEPYIHITHSCGSEKNSYKTFRVDLMENMYKSRFFDVIVDLDNETAKISSRLMFP